MKAKQWNLRNPSPGHDYHQRAKTKEDIGCGLGDGSGLNRQVTALPPVEKIVAFVCPALISLIPPYPMSVIKRLPLVLITMEFGVLKAPPEEKTVALVWPAAISSITPRPELAIKRVPLVPKAKPLGLLPAVKEEKGRISLTGSNFVDSIIINCYKKIAISVESQGIRIRATQVTPREEGRIRLPGGNHRDGSVSIVCYKKIAISVESHGIRTTQGTPGGEDGRISLTGGNLID